MRAQLCSVISIAPLVVTGGAPDRFGVSTSSDVGALSWGAPPSLFYMSAGANPKKANAVKEVWGLTMLARCVS